MYFPYILVYKGMFIEYKEIDMHGYAKESGRKHNFILNGDCPKSIFMHVLGFIGEIMNNVWCVYKFMDVMQGCRN